MISLRAPKIFTLLLSQAEFDCLFGLFRSSRSIFSPSLTAQMVRTEADVFATKQKQQSVASAARSRMRKRCDNLENVSFIVVFELTLCASSAFSASLR